LSLNTYTFSDTTKTIVKRRTKKRKLGQPKEASQELVQLWNATHLNEEEFKEEVVDALGSIC
jgi:hypothetical protein